MIVRREYEFWVYIMASGSGTLYVGMTGNLFVRTVRQHKAGKIEGFTKKYKCTRLVYYESYDHVHKALSREDQLKGWRRSKKIALIETKNPRWLDFAENWDKEIIFSGQSIKEAEEQIQRRIKLGNNSNPLSS